MPGSSKLMLAPILAILSVISCAKRTEQATSQGLVLKGTQWKNGEAWVCWATDGYTEQKTEIKGIIQSQFNARSSMKFQGFGECATQDRKDIRVSIEGGVEKLQAVGISSAGNVNASSMFSAERYLDKNRPFSPTMQYSPKLFLKEHRVAMLNVALHEFGHAAGLLHEHSRNDVSEACEAFLKGNGTKIEETIKKGAANEGFESIRTTQDYDVLSVMNYCFLTVMDNMKEAATLSQGDLASLAALYGPHTPSAKVETVIAPTVGACTGAAAKVANGGRGTTLKLVDDDSSRITEASAVCQLADGARLCFTSDQGNLTVNGNMRRALAQALPGCARFAEGQTVFAYDQHYTFDVQGL